MTIVRPSASLSRGWWLQFHPAPFDYASKWIGHLLAEDARYDLPHPERSRRAQVGYATKKRRKVCTTAIAPSLRAKRSNPVLKQSGLLRRP